MTVFLLFDYDDFVGIYADRTTAEADRDFLLAQARSDWEASAYRHTRKHIEPRIEIVEATPRNEPRWPQ